MGFGHKLFKGSKLNTWHLAGIGRKNVKKVRSHLHLTSKSKLFKGLKRSLRNGRDVFSLQPTSASSSTYTYQPRSLSQLTGGV